MLRHEKSAIEQSVESPAILRGRLSQRQREVLDGILAGKPNKVIAQDLMLSTRTVEAHRAAIMSKVGVSSVAELVRATALLSDGTASLAMLSRIYPGLVSFWDSALIARFANDLHESYFGKSVEDILGRSMEEVLGASSYQESLPFIRGVLRGKPQHFTQLLESPSGRQLTCCCVYSPQFDGRGAVEGFFVFMLDTKLLEGDAQVALAASEAADWAEMILDEGTRIISVNEAFTQITRFRLDEVRGQTPMVIRPASVEPAAFMKFWDDILAERAWRGTVWYRRRDGYLFRSRQQVTAAADRRGQVGCRVLFSEIKVS